ncbi:MAG: tyrosine-type recombinase/integrase, partial [Clostridiales bacterium]|nr:tyrosine-type recombinase/integrase [Candidatus Blautia equi]
RTVLTSCMNLCQKPFEQVDDEDAAKIFELYKGNCTARTSYTYFTILKRFSNYLIENDSLPGYDTNPFLPHFLYFQNLISSKDYTIISLDEFDQLLKAARIDSQYYAILVLIYRTAIKPDLICDIRIGDFYNDASGTYLRITKNRKEQILLIPEDLVKILDAYVKDYRIDLQDSARYLFLNKHHKKMDERTLERMMHMLCTEAGLGNRYTPHDIRNSAAALLFEYGATSAQVADQLKISMTHVNRYDRRTINQNIVSNANALVRIHIDPPN